MAENRVFRAAGASLLAAALALPTGLSVAAADTRGADAGTSGVPAQTTDAPPSPPPTEPTGPTEMDTPSPSPSEDSPPPDSDEPTDPTTSPSSPEDETSDTTGPTESDTTGGDRTTDPAQEQSAAIDRTTADLTKLREHVPEDLVGTVDTLIGIVAATHSPGTVLQDRQGIIESAEHLSTALRAISAPGTPPELRKELTAIVKGVTASLEEFSEPQMPPEERSMLILVTERTTSTLGVITDPETPPDVQDSLIPSVKDMNGAARFHGLSAGGDKPPSGNPSQSPGTQQNIGQEMVNTSGSFDIMHDRSTPEEQREQLAETTRQVSALLKKISDPATSQQDRSGAEKELDEKTSRMKDQQEDAADAQKRAKESLGKAAALCTSAVFETAGEAELMDGLAELVPAQWEDEGVKDFWKAEEESDEKLDVIAQLRSNEQAHGPFEVVPLITALAEVVPRDELYGSLGGAALYCRQTAQYLDDAGVTVSNWLARGGE